MMKQLIRKAAKKMGIIKRIFQKPLIKNYQINKEFKKTLLAIKGEKYRMKQEKSLSSKEFR